jgi:hypothetical protein
MLQFITQMTSLVELKSRRKNYLRYPEDRTILSNDAGFIGNIIGTALLYWNPTSPIYNTEEITIQ